MTARRHRQSRSPPLGFRLMEAGLHLVASSAD